MCWSWRSFLGCHRNRSFAAKVSVCKTWLSLSSDAVRLNKHLQPTMSGFLYNQILGPARFVNFLPCGINKVELDIGRMCSLSCHDHFRILDCCNGLLIVGDFKKTSEFAQDIHVCNPTTRTMFNLWYPKQQYHDIVYQAFSLAFDPQVFHQFHVIRFTGRYSAINSKANFIDIFSYERGKYKHHKKLVSDGIINSYCNGTLVNGRVHRLTTQNEILCIDPNICSYQVIRPPNLENRTLIEIGQSRGVLHCMSLSRDVSLFIWVLESYTREDWTLRYKLSLDVMYQAPIPYLYLILSIASSAGTLHFISRKNEVVSLDLSKAEGDKLDTRGNDRFDLSMRFWVSCLVTCNDLISRKIRSFGAMMNFCVPSHV